MKVAGFGCCTGATLASLRDVLEHLEGQFGAVDALAAVSDKAVLVRDLGSERGLPVQIIANEQLPVAETLTQSSYSEQARSTGSVAEAVALLAAQNRNEQRPRQARLLGARQISSDRNATCAMAEGVDP